MTSPMVEMFDDDTKIEIRKVDSETGNPLKGAKMQLILQASGEIIKEWITDETGAIQFFGLPAGVYLVKGGRGSGRIPDIGRSHADYP